MCIIIKTILSSKIRFYLPFTYRDITTYLLCNSSHLFNLAQSVFAVATMFFLLSYQTRRDATRDSTWGNYTYRMKNIYITNEKHLWLSFNKFVLYSFLQLLQKAIILFFNPSWIITNKMIEWSLSYAIPTQLAATDLFYDGLRNMFFTHLCYLNWRRV